MLVLEWMTTVMFKNKFLNVYMYLCTHIHTHHSICVVCVREQLVGVGSFHHVNDQIQVIRLSGTHVLLSVKPPR